MGQMQTPSTVHTEFDHMCQLLDEFEPLPAHPAAPDSFGQPDPLREADDARPAEGALNRQILAGLVCPV